MYNLMSHEGYEFHISLAGRSTRKGWLSGVRWWSIETERLQKITLCEGHRVTCIKYDLHCIPLKVLDLNTISVEKIFKFSIQMKNDNVHSKVYLTDLGLVWGILAFWCMLSCPLELHSCSRGGNGGLKGNLPAVIAVSGSSQGLGELYFLLNSTNSSLEW